MKNDKFWNECTPGSIREKVADFIECNPTLSKFEGQKYYDLEDALVEFIERNKRLIADEVDREYHRDDIISHAETKFGEQGARIAATLPIKYLDKLAEKWQSRVENNDPYWEAYWDSATITLEDDTNIFGNVDAYEEDDFLAYFAYINEWVDNFDDDGEPSEDPLSIDEFFNGELEEEIVDYYRVLAEQYKLIDEEPEDPFE